MMMRQGIVKYGNQLNTVPFKDFNRKDMNIFFAIVSRMRNKGTKHVTFTFTQLLKLSNLHYHHHPISFVRDLDKSYTKLIHLTYFENTPHRFRKGVLFNEFDVDKDHHTCTVQVNPNFAGVLNHLANWTRFSLEQFTGLRSTYAKNCFRLLKQWRTIGRLYLPSKKFRILMNVPKSYSNTQISRRVLKPIKVELTPLVRGLHVIKIKRGRGGRIVGYKFTFVPELNKADDFSKGKVKDKQIMLKNIENNPYLSQSLKNKAARDVAKRKKPITVKKTTPMKSFNRMLKTASLSTLRWYLSLHETKSPTVNFSEYQVRKLKKTIIKKHDDDMHKIRQRQTKLF